MFVIVLFHLCPQESLRVWNFNIFFQKCSYSTSTTFSSFVSFCIVYASTKCCSSASSSSNSSMNIGLTHVAPSFVCFLHANAVYFCPKTQLYMFQLYLCLELSSTQTISFHYMPSLLDILKMMMNMMITL